jgi:peptidoglycan/LPS O-acetylase OafA/YrhL
MVDIIGILFIILVLTSGRLVKMNRNLVNNELSKEYSIYLRGICATIVILDHISLRVNNDKILKIFSASGYLAVAFFFFISGYGIMIQFIKKGNKYLNGFLYSRIISVICPYYICLMIYIVVKGYLGLISLTQVFQSFLLWNSLVSFAWYVIVITIFYVMFWFTCKFLSNNYSRVVIYITIETIIYIIICLIFSVNETFYKSAAAFPLGIIIAVFNHKSQVNTLKFHTLSCLISGSLTSISFGVRYILDKYIEKSVVIDIFRIGLYQISVVSFCLFIFFFSQRIQFRNSIIKFLGKISYELYLVHGIFLIIFSSKLINLLENEVMYAIIVVIFSIITSWILQKMHAKIIKLAMAKKYVYLKSSSSKINYK